MQCIKIKDGEEILYLPREQIEQIEINPYVQQVPGSPAGICGISWYNGNLVVYYGNADKKKKRCGILWKPPQKKLTGLLADEILEESQPDHWEEEEQRLSVHYGLRTGENLSDTTK